MNVCFKRFIICFCICCSTLMFARPQRVNANPIALVGALVAPEVAVPLIILGGAFAGYELVSAYSDDVKSYITNQVTSLGLDALNSYLKFSYGSDGQEYCQLTGQGLSYSQNLISDYANKDSVSHDVSASTSASYVSSFSPADFQYQNLLMHPYRPLSVGGVYNSFVIAPGEVMKYLMNTSYSFGSPTVRTYTNNTINNKYVRFYQYGANEVRFEVSSDGVTYWYPNTYSTSVTDSNYFICIGYSTVSNTVYTPGSQVFINTGSTTSIGSTEAISVPISGQYDSSTGVKTYVQAPGSTATVRDVSADTTVDGTIAGTDAGAGTAVDAGTITDAINDADIGDLSVPSSATLNFAPLQIAGITFTTKFPFCIPWDLTNSVKSLSVAPVAPKWTIVFPSNYFVGGGSIDIDFVQFEAWAIVIRWGIFIIFCGGLIVITRKMIGSE